MKHKKANGKYFTKPRKYPNLFEIAYKIVERDKDADEFEISGWKVSDSVRKLVLHGRYLLKDDNGTVLEVVPFRFMLPRYDMNPVENMTIKFSDDDHIRYIRKRFKKQTGEALHEHIKGLLYEKLEKLKA